MSENVPKLNYPRDYTKVELVIEEENVGKFIGKHGCNIKKLKSLCWANISFTDFDQVLKIWGPKKDVKQSKSEVLYFARKINIGIYSHSKRKCTVNDVGGKKIKTKESLDERPSLLRSAVCTSATVQRKAKGSHPKNVFPFFGLCPKYHLALPSHAYLGLK